LSNFALLTGKGKYRIKKGKLLSKKWGSFQKKEQIKEHLIEMFQHSLFINQNSMNICKYAVKMAPHDSFK
jgi:hypothetical protein